MVGGAMQSPGLPTTSLLKRIALNGLMSINKQNSQKNSYIVLGFTIKELSGTNKDFTIP
jgi:hypothetical protein